jgi:hypothetical protein
MSSLPHVTYIQPVTVLCRRKLGSHFNVKSLQKLGRCAEAHLSITIELHRFVSSPETCDVDGHALNYPNDELLVQFSADQQLVRVQGPVATWQ